MFTNASPSPQTRGASSPLPPDQPDALHHLVSSVAPRTQAGFSPAPHGKPRCDVQHTFGGLLAEYSRARSHRSKLPAAGRSTRSEASSGCAALEGICPLHQRAVHGVGFGCHQQGLRSRGLLAALALRPDSCILAPRASERRRHAACRCWSRRWLPDIQPRCGAYAARLTAAALHTKLPTVAITSPSQIGAIAPGSLRAMLAS